MRFNNKIAIVIKNDLLDWQKLNVTAFLASSIAIKHPQTHGHPFVNASSSEYLPFIKQPILIYGAEDEEQMVRAFSRAKERELSIGIYTDPLFATKNEAENHTVFGKYTDEDQELVGLAIYGDSKIVDKALDKLKLHS